MVSLLDFFLPNFFRIALAISSGLMKFIVFGYSLAEKDGLFPPLSDSIIV
jgi:hypothetical protein